MRARFSRFSPHLVDPDLLEELTVGREQFLQGLISGIVGTLTEGGARYELIVGARGMGKSHLMSLLRHRLSRHEAIKAEAVIVALSEEEHVSSLLDLFARILRAMPASPELPPIGELLARLHTVPPATAERLASDMIAARLGDRALVLMFENLDRIFEALEDPGQKVLRSVLQEQGRWTVVASSQTAGEAFVSKKRPFYRMFSMRTLEQLTPEQCREVLRRLAVYQQRNALAALLVTPIGLARVRAIHHLTSGIPRAMALIFPYLTTDTLDSLTEAFFQLADELTPYFQEQIRSRPPRQQAILEKLSESWRPMNVTELSRMTFLEQPITSAQLKRLHTDRLVSRSKIGREVFYEIRDPLWRIARSSKLPGAIPEVFIRFLRHWHTPDEQRFRLEQAEDDGARQVWEQVLALKQVEPQSEWSKRLISEWMRLTEAGDHQKAMLLAKTFEQTEPCSISAFVLIVTRLNSGRFLQTADDSILMLSRVSKAWCDVFFAMFCRFGEGFGRELLERIRQVWLSKGPSAQVLQLCALWYPYTSQEELQFVAQNTELRTWLASRIDDAFVMGMVKGLVEHASKHHPPEIVTWIARVVPLKILKDSDYRVVFEAYAQQGRHDEALSWLDSLSLSPRQVSACLLALRGSLAAERIATLVEDYPEDSVILERAAWLSLANRDFDTCGEFVRLGVLSATIYRVLAIFYALCFRPRDAEWCFQMDSGVDLEGVEPWVLHALQLGFTEPLPSSLASKTTNDVSAFDTSEPLQFGMVLLAFYRAMARRSAAPVPAILRASANNYAAIGSALFGCCLVAAIEERPPADALSLFDGLSDDVLKSLGTSREFLTATARLREDRRLFLRLSAPERALIVRELRKAGRPGRAIADEVEQAG